MKKGKKQEKVLVMLSKKITLFSSSPRAKRLFVMLSPSVAFRVNSAKHLVSAIPSLFCYSERSETSRLSRHRPFVADAPQGDGEGINSEPLVSHPEPLISHSERSEESLLLCFRPFVADAPQGDGEGSHSEPGGLLSC